MERRSIETIARTARITRVDFPAWELRRRRLERLAGLLESTKAPVRLFTTMECYRKKERLLLRQPNSPLALACDDALLRGEGLAGDSVADGVAFFGLSLREAHALLCDCGYSGLARMGAPLAHLVATRARRLAAKKSLAEMRFRLAQWLG